MLEKGCKKHALQFQIHPKWEPKSRKKQLKTRSENLFEKGTRLRNGLGGSAGGAAAPSNILNISERLVFVFSAFGWRPTAL